MIEIKDNKLIVNGQALPKGDVDILKHLLREGKSNAFKLMELTGKIYVQYVQLRLRVLIMMGIVIKAPDEKRGVYEITPEIKEELRGLIENGQI